MTDEEILERAFLHALKKRFPKPGPWLPVAIYSEPLSSSWRSGVGEVWEIYVQLSSPVEMAIGYLPTTGPQEGGQIAYSAVGHIDNVWLPATGSGLYNFLGVGWLTCWITASEGWILGNGEGVIVGSPFMVRMRRRFDLE